MVRFFQRFAVKHFRRLYRAVNKWYADDGSLLAASVAYYAIFSMLPILMILISLLGVVLRFSAGAQTAQQGLLEMISESTSPMVANQVGELLSEVRTQALVSGPVGFLALLLAAIGIFAQFERAFEKIWNVTPSQRHGVWATVRRALWERFRAFMILIGLGAAVVGVFFAGVFLSTVQPVVERLPAGAQAWRFVQVPAMLVVSWGLFTVIYKVLPKVAVRWPDAARGGLLTAVLWEITRQVLTVLLASGRYSAYGVIGSLIILMLWVYVASCLLFLGAEYVQVLGEEREAGPPHGDGADRPSAAAAAE